MSVDEEITIAKVFEEIVLTRNELKNTIQASEVRLKLDCETLRKKISSLEKENADLKGKLELLDRNSRKNNLVVFGVQNPTEVTPDSICREVKNLVGVDLTVAEISNIFPLGRSNKCPVKIELVSQLKKTLILKNCKKLKGTNVYIVNDLTETQRVENKILRKHLSKARETVTNIAYIKGNKLFVNDIGYTIEDLEPQEIEDEEENTNKYKNRSAPSSPSIHNQQVDTPERELRSITTLTTTPSTEKSSLLTQGTPKLKKKVQQDNRLHKPIITKEKLRSYSTKEKSK